MAHVVQGQDEQLLAHLQAHLPGWHLARQKFFALFLLALIKARTVSFSRIAPHLWQARPASNLRRIQRFFADFDLDFNLVARIVWALLPSQPPYRLCLDRTHWCFGGVDCNILTLSVITPHRLSIPLLWTMLPKPGNSSQAERRQLLERFMALFGAEAIEHLVADREFVGTNWFGFLIQRQIRFFIRLPMNLSCQAGRHGHLKVGWLFNPLPLNTLQQRYKPLLVNGQWVYLSGLRRLGTDGQIDYLIVASYAFEVDALSFYGERWQTECLFKALKTSGFHLQDTHLTDLRRLEKLLAVVAIAFVWLYRIGEFCHHQKPILVKAHQRWAQSLFRYGLDACLHALAFDRIRFTQFVQLLSCT